MDERLNEKIYADIITVAKGTGMCHIELKRLKKEQLEIKDGRTYIFFAHGEGSLRREIPVLKIHQAAVIDIFNKSKNEK